MAKATFHPEYGTATRGEVRVGTFIYSGFGMGHLFLWRGQALWLSPSKARDICDRIGVTYRHADSLRSPPKNIFIYTDHDTTGPHVFCRTYYGKHKCA